MEIKGKHFRAEVPKAFKNMEHQKSSASASSGGSAPFMASIKGQAWVSCETPGLSLMHVKSCARVQKNLQGRQLLPAGKSSEIPASCRKKGKIWDTLASLSQFLMVLQSHVIECCVCPVVLHQNSAVTWLSSLGHGTMWPLLVQDSACFQFSALLLSVPAHLRGIFILLISALPVTEAGVMWHPFTSFGLIVWKIPKMRQSL